LHPLPNAFPLLFAISSVIAASFAITAFYAGIGRHIKQIIIKLPGAKAGID
jgi:hypothetical protein